MSPPLHLFPTLPRARARARKHSRAAAGTVRRVMGIGMGVPCLVSLAAHAHGMRRQDTCCGVRVRMCACDRARARERAVHTNACGMARRGGAVCMAGPHSTARSGAPCIDFISDASLSIASRSSAARAQPQDATRRSVSSRTARQCQGHGLPPAPPGPGMGRLGGLTLRAAWSTGGTFECKGAASCMAPSPSTPAARTPLREYAQSSGAPSELLPSAALPLPKMDAIYGRCRQRPLVYLRPVHIISFLPVFLLPRNLHTSGHHQVERRGDRSDGWHRVEQVGASGPSRQARSDPGKGCRARARAVCALDCVLCSPSCTCGQRAVRAFRNPPPNPVRRHLRRAVSVSSARGTAAQGGAGGGASRNVGCGGAMRARGALGHVWACACIHVLVQALPSLALPAAASSQGAPLMPAGARARLVACPAPQHSTLLSQHVLLSALRAARTRRATWRTTPQRAR